MRRRSRHQGLRALKAAVEIEQAEVSPAYTDIQCQPTPTKLNVKYMSNAGQDTNQAPTDP
jgi:hypothetical protein